MRGASLLVLPWVNSTPELLVFSMVYGLNWLSTVPATSAMAADLFGKRNIGVVFGWIFFSHQVGAAASAYGASFLRTMLGDYTLVFMMSGAFALIGAGLILCVRTSEGKPAGA